MRSSYGLKRVKAERAFESTIHQTVFVPAHEVKASLFLEPLENGAPYIIMPATFGAGQKGPFSIGIHSDMPCEFELIPDVNAAAAATAQQRDVTAG